MHKTIDTTCEHIKLRLIAAAIGLQQCTQTAANVIPIPDGRVIVIGTPAEVVGLLPSAHLAGQSQLSGNSGELASQSQATKAQAEPIYQVQFVGQGSAWQDASEAAYHTFMPARRRIVYAAPTAKEAPPELTNEAIDEVYGAMPGGTDGWLKQFGYRQFARSIARYVLVRVAASMAGTIRPTDDELWEQTIGERDNYHEWADKLAEAIAKYFGSEIGEHSNMNCPWAEALDVIEHAEPFAGPGASELANRFLVWPLPNSLRAKFPGIERPIGAYMMSADEARAMFEHCLPGSEAVDEEQYNDIAAEPVASVAVDATREAETACTVPPPGWHCTRAAGHEGPCAAIPVDGAHRGPNGKEAIAILRRAMTLAGVHDVTRGMLTIHFSNEWNKALPIPATTASANYDDWAAGVGNLVNGRAPTTSTVSAPDTDLLDGLDKWREAEAKRGFVWSSINIDMDKPVRGQLAEAVDKALKRTSTNQADTDTGSAA